MADYQLTQTGPEVQEALNSVGPNAAAIEAEVARAEAAEHELNESIIDESEARADADAALARDLAADAENLATNYFNKEQVTNLIIPQDEEPIVVDALPAEGEPGKIYRVPGTDSYSDYAWDGTEWVLLATHNIDAIWPQIGFYECATAAGTAAKTVAAPGYILATGGNVRIKMTYANTAANVTLNINSTGAKALYYDGAQASATNSWDAGDVLTIYYDGTQYQVQVSAGTAEKVKYDNSTSNLASDNVQGAIDGLASQVESNAASDNTMLHLESDTPVFIAGAYSTNNVLWNGSLNVGQTFAETIVQDQSGCVIYKIAVSAGQVVKFNVKPSGYGSYGQTLLTDLNLVVKSKKDRDTINDGTTINVEYDGYLYTSSTNSVNNPFNIQVYSPYYSNKKLTSLSGRATAENVSYDKTDTPLRNDNVQDVIGEILGYKLGIAYTLPHTGRWWQDSSINANGNYKYSSPIFLQQGNTLCITTWVDATYACMAITNVSESNYTVVEASVNRSGTNKEMSVEYYAEEDCYVAVSLKNSYANNEVKVRYPFPIKAEHVSYDKGEDEDILVGATVQTAISSMYKMIAGSIAFDYVNKGQGFVRSDTATIQNNGYFRYSEPIALKQGDEIIVTTMTNAYYSVISLTDTTSSYYLPVVIDSSSSVKTFTYTAVEDCYVCVSHHIDYTQYAIKYFKRFAYEALSANVSQIKKDGGIFIAMGDSITAGAYSWPMHVSNHFSISMRNIAVAGAAWCSEQPFKVDLSGNYNDSHTVNNIENQFYRLMQMATPLGEIVPELTADMTYAEGYSYPILGTGEIANKEDVRLIGISCGVNDGGSYDTGDLSTICANTDVRTLDRSKFYGIIRWTCVLLQYYFPNARIFLLTPITGGTSAASYARSKPGGDIKTIAYPLGVNVVDMQYCGISSAVAGMTIEAGTNNKSRYFTDGLHANNYGEKLMGDYIASMLDCWWKY